MERIAIYARVSTSDQRLDAQIDALRAYAARRGAEALEFVDHGVSGSRDRRPGLQAMLAAARRREVSAVVVARLDRLARSLAHMARLGEEFRELGVDLVSLHESIDTTSSTGRALFGMCGVFAQLEADLIRERTRAGLKAARRRGARLGRPRALNRSGVERARRLRAQGRSLRSIAKLLDVGVATVSRAVSAR